MIPKLKMIQTRRTWRVMRCRVVCGTVSLFFIAAAVHAQTPESDTEANLQRERERVENMIARTPPGVPLVGPRGMVFRNGVMVMTPFGPWWSDMALVERLEITEEQGARIQSAFENHRQRIVTTTERLEREEATLAELLDADPINRPLTVAQIEAVIRARSDMERESSLMTLEMREALTPAQWTILQQQQVRVPAAGPQGVGARGRPGVQ